MRTKTSIHHHVPDGPRPGGHRYREWLDHDDVVDLAIGGVPEDPVRVDGIRPQEVGLLRLPVITARQVQLLPAIPDTPTA